MSKSRLDNVEKLRNHAIDMLLKLEHGEIDLPTAREIGKSYENIINSVKIQLEYAKLTNVDPEIGFLKIDTTEKSKMDNISYTVFSKLEHKK